MRSGFYVLAAAIVVLAACGARPGTSSETTFVLADEFATRSTVADLARTSDAVIIGTVRSEAGTRNMARNPDDRLKEDSFYVVLGQDYVIDVEEAIKGDAAGAITLTVARAHGNVENGVFPDADFVPLRTGQRYLLFLVTQVDGTQGFVPAPEPFRFALGATAIPESRWSDARAVFPARGVAQFIQEVRQIVR